MAGNAILVIDGDLASRNYVSAALEKAGHRVLQAASGKEGLVIAWRDHPELVVVEPLLPDLSGEELATRLRSDSRTSKVPLVALSRDASPARLKSCTEAGFNEYLVKSPTAITGLINTIAMLLEGEEEGREGGLLIVFGSAKGGTGTSSLCANIAQNIAVQNPESSVVVADLVLPIGSIAGIVGYRDEQNVVRVASMPADQTSPEFLRNRLSLLDDWRFHLLAGAPDPQKGNELVVSRIADLVAGAKSAYDFVLVDVGRSLSRITLPLIEHADLTVIVLGADMSTVNLTRTVWDYLQSKGLKPGSVFPLLNRAVGLEGLTKAEIEQVLGIPIKTSIPYLGSNFSIANNQHQPYSVKFPRDTASIALKDTAALIVEAARRTRAG